MADNEHAAMLAAGEIHRGPFAGEKIVDVSSADLQEILDKYRKPGRRLTGTRAALVAAIEAELAGRTAEPSVPAKPKKSTTIFNRRSQERARELGGDSYASRNKNLRLLGFENYAAYLASPLWER